jgi:hypothetical protein
VWLQKQKEKEDQEKSSKEKSQKEKEIILRPMIFSGELGYIISLVFLITCGGSHVY